MAIDVSIQADLGGFFGAKLRAGILYRMHEQTGDRMVLEGAVNQYRRARTAWAELANRAQGVTSPTSPSASIRNCVGTGWTDCSD